MKNSKLTTFIFLSLILGILTGALFPKFAIKLSFLSSAFLNMVKMIIAPLLFATLVVGIAGHGDIKNLGKLGAKTLIYFEVLTTLALVTGLFIGNVVHPGRGLTAITNTAGLDYLTSAMTKTSGSFTDMIINLFPTSVVDAMATGNLLQIVVFALFFAIAICAVGEKAKPVLNVLNSLSDIMFKFTEYVMYFAPIGIYGAIASTIGQSGIGILKNYAKIIFGLYLALALFVLIVIVINCKIVKVSFRKFMQAIWEPFILAFSTSSSEAALPKAMEIMEEYGVPKNIIGFVMPTGYTFNLVGSTLYLAIGVIFATEMVGIDLTLKQQIMLMLVLMLTSKGIAAVPRVSLVVLAGTLASFGYPLTGVAILLGIDQLLDMGRTAVNLIGNCLATVVIAVWENCFDYNKMNNYLETNTKHFKDFRIFQIKRNKNDKNNTNNYETLIQK